MHLQAADSHASLSQAETVEAGTAAPTDQGTQDWVAAERSIARCGHAVLPRLLTEAQCAALAAGYADTRRYRSRVVMARHHFGCGEYQYFAYPLPPLVEGLRTALYPWLAPIANRWSRLLGSDTYYPGTLSEFLARCHAAGQARPTPLILEYHAGGYNCLHQDLYGELVFPLQVAVLLSQPGRDFTGGEFMTMEKTSRGQRAEVVPLCQGDAVVFAVNHRPAMGGRGVCKAEMRHGVSQVRSGRRHALGVIFHDAQ
jgi:hypothetical protein